MRDRESIVHSIRFQLLYCLLVLSHWELLQSCNDSIVFSHFKPVAVVHGRFKPAVIDSGYLGPCTLTIYANWLTCVWRGTSGKRKQMSHLLLLYFFRKMFFCVKTGNKRDARRFYFFYHKFHAKRISFFCDGTENESVERQFVSCIPIRSTRNVISFLGKERENNIVVQPFHFFFSHMLHVQLKCFLILKSETLVGARHFHFSFIVCYTGTFNWRKFLSF